MTNPISYLEAKQIPPEHICGGFSQFFPIALPGAQLDVIKSAFGDLYQLGLISTDKNIFTTMTSVQGLRLLGDRVTQLGKVFISFCTAPQ